MKATVIQGSTDLQSLSHLGNMVVFAVKNLVLWSNKEKDIPVAIPTGLPLKQSPSTLMRVFYGMISRETERIKRLK